MNVSWHTAVASVVSILAIVVGGHVVVLALHRFLDEAFVNEIPGVAFAAFPFVQRPIEKAFHGFSGTRVPDPAIFRSWLTSGLRAAAMMTGLVQGTSLLLAVGALFQRSLLLGAGIPAATLAQVTTAETLGCYIVGLLPLVLAGWIYFGVRIQSRTRSWAPAAIAVAAFSYLVFNSIVSAVMGDVGGTYFPGGQPDYSSIASALFVLLALPAIGMSIGAVVSRFMGYRSLAQIDIIARRLPPEKRDEAAAVLLDILHRPAVLEPYTE